ncbi:helix-turn-helix domain-containing protein [Agromyces laixinhei]|uniref:helix-turn-helix domain-containing protein n=1 Tax=Agromyces laixinhei TaxID=2585717 RepID=UPI001115C0FD|nr:helix-turn-helix domain-containing protein [Agromyces laixinhei]
MAEPADLADVILHPVRFRILQQVGGRDVTTADLRTALPDVSQATLYRHVAALVDAGILAVAEERRVRGAVERTLTLGDRMAHVDAPELHAMKSAELRRWFLTFLAELGRDFERFVDADDAAALRDFVGFGQVPLYVTTDDLAALQNGLSELITPLLADSGDGKQRVLFSTALVPDPDPPPASRPGA